MLFPNYEKISDNEPYQNSTLEWINTNFIFTEQSKFLNLCILTIFSLTDTM